MVRPRRSRILTLLAILLVIGITIFVLRSRRWSEPGPVVVSPLPEPSASEGEIPLQWVRLDSEFDQVASRTPVLPDSPKRLPRPPFLLEGCEGEACGQVKSLALICEARFYSDPGKSGSLSFTLPAGTTLVKARVYTLVKRLGAVTIPTEKKKLPVIRNAGEGEWLIWEDNDFGSWTAAGQPPNALVEPVTEEWIYGQDEEGRRGWLKLYDPARSCPFESL